MTYTYDTIEWCYQNDFLQVGHYPERSVSWSEPHFHVSFECKDGVRHVTWFATRHEAHLFEVDLRANCDDLFCDEFGIQHHFHSGV
jgi:hypothetical protein